MALKKQYIKHVQVNQEKKFQFDNTECFSCSTDQRRPNAQRDALPALRRKLQLDKTIATTTV
jgi:hypothetical protein